MTAFNAVRFRVRPGQDQKFIDAHKNISWPGLRHAYMIKTSDHTYRIIAEWPDMETLANARPNMIATLVPTLEELASPANKPLRRLCWPTG